MNTSCKEWYICGEALRQRGVDIDVFLRPGGDVVELLALIQHTVLNKQNKDMIPSQSHYGKSERVGMCLL